MNDNPDPYRLLAQRLDALPNGFPPAPDDEVLPPPVTEADWRAARSRARGLDLAAVL